MGVQISRFWQLAKEAPEFADVSEGWEAERMR